MQSILSKMSLVFAAVVLAASMSSVWAQAADSGMGTRKRF